MLAVPVKWRAGYSNNWLGGQVPADRLAISESGIHIPADVQRLRTAGVHVFLVGEVLMRAADPGTELAHLFATSD